MHKDDQPYLGMTPFSGLQVLARPRQGLIGQSEELDKLLTKVLKEEIAKGIITKIQDDVIVSRDTQMETGHNYNCVCR